MRVGGRGGGGEHAAQAEAWERARICARLVGQEARAWRLGGQGKWGEALEEVREAEILVKSSNGARLHDSIAKMPLLLRGALADGSLRRALENAARETLSFPTVLDPHLKSQLLRALPLPGELVAGRIEAFRRQLNLAITLNWLNQLGLLISESAHDADYIAQITPIVSSASLERAGLEAIVQALNDEAGGPVMRPALEIAGQKALASQLNLAKSLNVKDAETQLKIWREKWQGKLPESLRGEARLVAAQSVKALKVLWEHESEIQWRTLDSIELRAKCALEWGIKLSDLSYSAELNGVQINSVQNSSLSRTAAGALQRALPGESGAGRWWAVWAHLMISTIQWNSSMEQEKGLNKKNQSTPTGPSQRVLQLAVDCCAALSAAAGLRSAPPWLGPLAAWLCADRFSGVIESCNWSQQDHLDCLFLDAVFASAALPPAPLLALQQLNLAPASLSPDPQGLVRPFNSLGAAILSHADAIEAAFASLNAPPLVMQSLAASGGLLTPLLPEPPAPPNQISAKLSNSSLSLPQRAAYPLRVLPLAGRRLVETGGILDDDDDDLRPVQPEGGFGGVLQRLGSQLW